MRSHFISYPRPFDLRTGVISNGIDGLEVWFTGCSSLKRRLNAAEQCKTHR
jgi:hypothetical protein